jgi:predicted O-methyltransferase YrrM
MEKHIKGQESEKKLAHYILTTGNRISQTKIDLIEETNKLFPEWAIMLTALEECELLRTLVQISGAKKGIEIGVFVGMSSLSIAEGLPEDGKLLALDISEEYTNVAKKYWEKAGVDKKIDLILGNAVQTLQTLADDPSNLNSFDFAYVDADKLNYLVYYEILLKLVKPNGFIVFDNVIWSKKVIDETDNSSITVSMRKLNKTLHDDDRVDVNMLNIGDGINIVRKK